MVSEIKSSILVGRRVTTNIQFPHGFSLAKQRDLPSAALMLIIIGSFTPFFLVGMFSGPGAEPTQGAADHTTTDYWVTRHCKLLPLARQIHCHRPAHMQRFRVCYCVREGSTREEEAERARASKPLDI